MSTLILKKVSNTYVENISVPFNLLNQSWTPLPLSYELYGPNRIGTNNFGLDDVNYQLFINIILYSNDDTAEIMVAYGDESSLSTMNAVKGCNGCPYIVNVKNIMTGNSSKIYSLWFSSDKNVQITITNIVITMIPF